jgi:hypothetical protein
MPPPDSCNLALPGSFTVHCSACHTQNGQVNTRYPDLYKFQGSLDFTMRVRTGSAKGMAAYPADLVSDADIAAIFAFFTNGQMGRGQTAIDLGGVIPLFSAADATNPPIVAKRDDGALVTRGAGRVRGRHEKEGSFGTYGPHYFQNRSYGFVVEDFTPVGEKRIRVTYLPLATPDHTNNRITNWRAWKVLGNNATFMENKYMIDVTSSPIAPTAPVALVQQYDERFVPQTRTLDVGQNFEFEFGIFIDPAALTTPGSRNSYYTDTFRYQIGVGGLTPNNLDFADTPGPAPQARLGGDTTLAWLFAEPDMYFSQMSLNTQRENVQAFLEGRRLFHTDFATGQHSETGNPVFTEQMAKAGPLGTSTSCENCHVHNGPGELLEAPLDAKSSMVFAVRRWHLGNRPSSRRARRRSAARREIRHPRRRHRRVAPSAQVRARGQRGDVTHSRLVSLASWSGSGYSKRSTNGRSSRAPIASTATTTASPDDRTTSKDPVSGVLRIGRMGGKRRRSPWPIRWPTLYRPTSA